MSGRLEGILNSYLIYAITVLFHEERLRCSFFFFRWCRRTGITLKEGKLDEDGMEEIDGMFSSPEKSPGNTNGNTLANHTMLSSEGMETGGSKCCSGAFIQDQNLR